MFMDWVKKQNPKDLAEVALMGALAYAGYQTFKDWRGALLGPVSLKLATTTGGTPPAAQIAGITGLGMLGVSAAVRSDLSSSILNQIPPEYREEYRRRNKAYLDYIDFLSRFTPIGIASLLFP